MLDLYVCLRPVRWFKGVPSPVKRSEKVDMVIFRENTEDIYAGIEFESGTEDVKKVLAFLKEMSPKFYAKIRFPETMAMGFKPVSSEGTERLVRAAIEYALEDKRKSVTFVHKGNIMKFTEGAFRNWATPSPTGISGTASTPGISGSARRRTRERTPPTPSRRRPCPEGVSSSRTRWPTSPSSRSSPAPTSST